MKLIKFKNGKYAVANNDNEEKELLVKYFDEVSSSDSFNCHNEENYEKYKMAVNNYNESIEKAKYIIKALEEEEVSSNNYLYADLKGMIFNYQSNKNEFVKLIEEADKINSMLKNKDKEMIYDYIRNKYVVTIVEINEENTIKI